MLIALSEALDTPVNILLGETIAEAKADSVKVLSEKLEVINLQLAQRTILRRKVFHLLFLSFCTVIILIFVSLILIGSPYLNWNYTDPETAVVGVLFHIFEWTFIRLAPILFIGSVVGIFLTRQNRDL